MRVDSGGRIPVDSSDDSTWEGGGETVAMDHTGRGEWPPELPDVLSGKGGTAEIPCGGVPRESGDEYGNAGALRALACPQHRGDSGVRKLPPPIMRPVQHISPPEGAERAAPGYSTMPQGSRKEETTAGGGGDVGEFGAGI